MSIWNIDNEQREYKKLSNDIEVDTLIIGAGITGLTAGYLMKNKRVCVVDASRIGHGVTLGSTAKITYLQERVYENIEKFRNREIASKYLQSQKYAINLIKNIIKKEKIECDLKQTPSYVFASTKEEIYKLQQEVAFLKENGVKITKSKLPAKITSYCSYRVNDTYTFNPIKYLEELYKILVKNKIEVYENSKIVKIVKQGEFYISYTETNSIISKNIIVACNYPYFMKHNYLPIRSYIEKSYMIVSKVNEDGNFSCINSKKPTYSTRFYQNNEEIYQICLAESHNIAFNQNDKYHFERVKEIFQIAEKDIIMFYSNQDIMTPDNMPYIGQINKGMYISTGYNTWGMTNGVLGAKIIVDLIKKINNEFSNIFNPKRITLAHILSLPYITFSNIKSYMGSKILKNKSWYNNKIKFFKEGNKSCASYEDENGTHIIINKCPHLGCSLIFNEAEKTWDCPCHSSRFDIDGKCIKGPSNYDISYK